MKLDRFAARHLSGTEGDFKKSTKSMLPSLPDGERRWQRHLKKNPWSIWVAAWPGREHGRSDLW
jgi:hypothetical protein